MGQTIAIINRKGGVSKTTTALALVEELRARGRKVLLVDLDQQHNGTVQYGAKIEDEATVFDLMTDPACTAIECVQRTEAGDIIAGDDLVNNLETEMASMIGRDTVLADKLLPLKDVYDEIVIDCPPGLGVVVVNILIAADKLIVPMFCDGFSIEGFNGLLKLVHEVKSSPRLNPGLEIAGILITQYEARQKLSRTYDEQMPEVAEHFGTRLFDARIRRCAKVKQAQDARVPLFEFAPSCTAAEDYRAWVDELVEIGVV